jgi:protein-tyrosine phosphatase
MLGQPKECDNCMELENKGIIYCKFCFRNRITNADDAEINKISDKVFLGNEEGAMLKEKLKSLGITHILICGVDLIKFHENDFKYFQLNIEDYSNENIKKYFREALSFIESSKKIYVHCWAGVSRSASIVIAYFMWKQKLNFIESKKLVERGRECINPNEGFIKQLMEFEKFLGDNNFKLSRKFK